jgi:molybdopterin synthase sulfur carrier subunit
MTVLILYFAALRELVGVSEERLSGLSHPLSVRGLAQVLVGRYPQLGPHLVSVRFAVNETFADASAQIEDGDTVALIPPVSGG